MWMSRRKNKDEGARFTVNRRGDPTGDVNPTDAWFAMRHGPLHTGIKASKGRTPWRGLR